MEETPKARNMVTAAILISCTAVLTVGYCFLLSKDLVRPGGYSPEWTWGHRGLDANSLPNLKVLYQASLITIVFTALAWLSANRYKNSKIIVLVIMVFAILLMFYLYFGLTIESNYNFHSIPIMIANECIVGPFQDATKVTSPVSLLKSYGDIQLSLTGQSHTHPPGNVLFFWVIIVLVAKIPLLGDFAFWLSDQLKINREYLASIDIILRDPIYFKASIISGLLIPIINFLAIIPTYAVARFLFNKKIGLIALLLSLSIPSYLVVSPQIDQMFVPLAMTFLAIYLAAIKRNSPALAVVAGIILIFSFFFTIAMILMLPIALIATIIYRMKQGESDNSAKTVVEYFRQTLRDKLFWLTAGTTITFFLLFIALGINMIAIITTILKVNDGFNKGSHGPPHLYSFWIVNNLYDFFFFLGIPITMLAIWQLFKRKSAGLARRGWIFGLSMFTFIVVLDLICINRGEVARLWMFLMPLFIITASVTLHEIGERSDKMMVFLLVAITSLMILQSTAFRIFMNIYNLVNLPFFNYPVNQTDFSILHFRF